MNSTAINKQEVSIDAIVYPPCECGEPWAKHGECGGYKPSRPVENYGTIVFRSSNWLATAIFKCEILLRKLRFVVLRSM